MSPWVSSVFTSSHPSPIILTETVCAVRQAVGRKTVRIVSHDWLEDSLLKQAPQRAKDYLLKKHLKMREALKGKRRVKRTKDFRKGGKFHNRTRVRLG